LLQVRNADKIVLVADQIIKAIGSHDELMDNSTEYRDLVNLQMQQPEREHFIKTDEVSIGPDWVIDLLEGGVRPDEEKGDNNDY
jgi:hypothetical protein